MGMVFCKDCEHLSPSKEWESTTFCVENSNVNIIKNKNWYHTWETIEYIKTPQVLNRFNDCKHFKQK
jgi:hypothetical protein